MSKFRIIVTATIKQTYLVDIPTGSGVDPWDFEPGADDEPISETDITEVTSVERVEP